MENYVHQINPIAVSIYGDLAVRWYGLAYLGGLIFGLFLMKAMSKRGGNFFTLEQLSDLVTWSALGVMIGGRLGYCVFYSPNLLFEFGGGFPFWGVLKVWEGGMASHGGFIGVIVSSLLFAKKHKLSWFHVNDVTVLGGSLGFLFGRLANFVNGELYGRVVEKPISWGVKFPQEMFEWLNYSPQKLNALAPLAEKFAGSPGLSEKLTAYNWEGLVSGFSVNAQSRNTVESFVIWLQNQAMNGNQVVVEALGTVLPSRYPSQLVQALCEGLFVFLVLNLIWMKPRKPGVITAWFGILYAVARIFGEQFRMPDKHIGFQALGLTRGQWLSVVMLLVGFALLYYSSRKNVEKAKGWSTLFSSKV